MRDMLTIDKLYPVKTKKQKRQLLGVRRMLFIDPGLGGTGWAYFDKLSHRNPHMPSETGVLRAKGETWVESTFILRDKLKEIVERLGAGHMVIELPVLWQGSALSVAASARGDLAKLSYLSGMLGSSGAGIGCKVLTMEPNRWKGQLPKAAVIKRIMMLWKNAPKVRDHEADAIAMGFSAQGAL